MMYVECPIHRLAITSDYVKRMECFRVPFVLVAYFVATIEDTNRGSLFSLNDTTSSV